MEVTIDQLLQSVGEKQVKLDMLAAYANRIERENVDLRATVDALNIRVAELEATPPTIDIESARMEAGE